MVTVVWGARPPEPGVMLVEVVSLPRGEYQRARQLTCWSEGICPSCLHLLTMKRFCQVCKIFWHCRRDPMPEEERSRVRGRWQDHATLEAQEPAY